jgi:hypothetical protein
MPVMDGLAATRAIRQAEKDGKRPGRQRIVGLTGNARGAQKDSALEAGMDTVVTKPYKCVDLPSPPSLRLLTLSLPRRVPDLIEKIRNAGVTSADPGSTTLNPINPGHAKDVTIMAAPSSDSEETFRLDGGSRVEVITSGSPTSSTSSKLQGDERSSPQRPEGLSREYSASSSAPAAEKEEIDEVKAHAKTEFLTRKAEEAKDSMEHHGAGAILPPSHDPERSLKK